ncbi:MAG TPA: hypothetical protein VJ961_00945 [Mariprofundaceae bacterium]|nr:hypothetical protein [Mariprofundaceae bacterium]
MPKLTESEFTADLGLDRGKSGREIRYVSILALSLGSPKPLGNLQLVGNTSLTTQQLSLEKILFFVVAGAMPVKDKRSFLYGCNLNTAKIAASPLIQLHQ